jgi:hypothetical protein
MVSSSYDTEVRENPRYLHVIACGDYRFEHSQNLISFVRDEALKRRQQLVLVDLLGVPQPIPDYERFELGSLAAQELRELKLAVVDLTEAPDKFAELVAANRGANIRIFTTEADALSWLLGSAS